MLADEQHHIVRIPVRSLDEGADQKEKVTESVRDVHGGVQESAEESCRHGISDELKALEDRHLRTVAELQTLRRRTDEQIERARREERERILAEWLAVADNMERALAMRQDASDTWTQGMEAIYRQVLAVLEKFGVKPYRPEGEDFDPNLHEAVQVVDDPSLPEGKIAGVVQTGYMMDDRVLRPAKVVVVRHR